MVSREEHSHPSTIPTWSNEPGGRHGIEIHEGLIRLETGSFRFSENQQEVWSSGSGPVCNQINQPVPSLLQLVARSICRSNRRLSPGLDNSERFCQPTLEPSTESANKNTESRGRSNSGSPSMEISAMVSPPTVITSRLATSATQAGHGNRVSPNNAPTSRWSISGKDSMNKVFQAKLQTSSSIHGGQKQTSPMTHYSGDGIAGVLNGVPLHFQDL